MKKQKLNIIHDANRSNTIDDIIKSYEDSRTPTKIPQSVRKRDDKARTLVPKYNEKSNRLKNLEKEYQNTKERKILIRQHLKKLWKIVNLMNMN